MKKDKTHNINTSGFKTPGNYFESFDEKLMKRLDKEKSIEEISSPGFTVPKDYFTSVDAKILDAVKSESETKVVRLFSKKQLYFTTGIAASLLLMLAVFNGSTSDELSVEMVEDYFAESSLDSYELAELLSDANILEDDFTITEINNSEKILEDYLLENADIEAILE